MLFLISFYKEPPFTIHPLPLDISPSLFLSLSLSLSIYLSLSLRHSHWKQLVDGLDYQTRKLVRIITSLCFTEALYNAYKKMTSYNTNDRPIHKLNYQWQSSIHFNWPIFGHHDVIFYMYYKKLLVYYFLRQYYTYETFGSG